MDFDTHEKKDEIYERYLTLIQQVKTINIKTEEVDLSNLTLQIYNELNTIKLGKHRY